MITQSTPGIQRRWALALALALPALGQIAQDRPGLCGRPNEPSPVPTGVSATCFGSSCTLAIELGRSTAKIEMPGDGVIDEVCSVAKNRLLVLADPGPPVYDIYIIGRATGAVVDRMDAASPAVSPDQHWLAMRAFGPPSSDMNYTEEYLLYDLTKNAVKNRTPGAGDSMGPGQVTYPAVPNHVPFNQYGVRPEYVHTFWSDSFFWSADSRSIVFADATPAGLAVVLIRIVQNEPIAYVHPLTLSEVCEGAAPRKVRIGGLTMSKAVVGNAEDSIPEILVDFRPADTSCTAKTLVLRGARLPPAALEQHPPPPPKKPSHRIN